MALEVFGWEFKRKDKDNEESKGQIDNTFQQIQASPVPPENTDGALQMTSNAYGGYAFGYDFMGEYKDQNALISKYRDIAHIPQVDSAIQEIINDSIVTDEDDSPVEIVLDDLEDYSDDIKDRIREEFQNILRLLRFNFYGPDIFKKWYVDSVLYYHISIDPNNPKNGIKELRQISPFNIKKIREEVRKPGPAGTDLITGYKEYYTYTDNRGNKHNNLGTTSIHSGITLTNDSVCYVHSGVFDDEKNFILGNLYKAIKPANMLRMMEDALVIYRIARAPERRIFYVDTGNLQGDKAESYVRSIMNKFKNKLTYDSKTGSFKDEKNVLSMMEDYWLPRREGARGTEVTTLQGGQNLGDINDIDYFKKNLVESLNVPFGRFLEGGGGFTIGRSSEITREEIKFAKFVTMLRKRFSILFYNLLKTQLLLKRVVSYKEWNEIQENIRFDFLKDSFFSEMKNNEILNERLATLDRVAQWRGVFYSDEYIKKHILKQTEEEIEEIKEQIAEEKKEGVDHTPDQQGSFGGSPFGGGNMNDTPPNDQGQQPQAKPNDTDKKKDDGDDSFNNSSNNKTKTESISFEEAFNDDFDPPSFSDFAK